jgi:putative oxidoreductase
MAHPSLFDSIGRCVMAFFFIASGLGKVFGFRPSAAILTTIGFPVPTIALAGIILVEVVGGLALMFDLWTTNIALALIAFLIFATIAIHGPFLRDQAARTDQIVHVIKNVAIIGGLITLIGK